MEDLILDAIAGGYKLSFQNGGYSQLLMSLEKDGVTHQQVFPDDHYNAKYCKSVMEFIKSKFN